MDKAHTHKWTYKWEVKTHKNNKGGFRYCKCGIKEWRLGCWTNEKWVSADGTGLYHMYQNVRPDLSLAAIRNFMADPPEEFIRHWDLIPPRILDYRINIIGLGGIGSFLVLGLAKMGFENLHIWEYDKVGRENVGTQLYGKKYVEEPKAIAMETILNTLVGTDHVKNYQYKGKWLSARMPGLTIMAVDSMEARKNIWQVLAHKDDPDYTSYYDPHRLNWLVDARMGAEQASIYSIHLTNEHDRAMYKKTLYTDEQAIQEPCTARATVYTGFLIAGMICKTVRDILSGNRKYPRCLQWDIANNDLQVTTPQSGITPAPIQSGAQLVDIRYGEIPF